MINYLKVHNLFNILLSLPEMSMFRGLSTNLTIRDFMQDYRQFQRNGLTGSIDVYANGTQICSIPRQLIDNLNMSTGRSSYWQHEGIILHGRMILPLWTYNSSIGSGVWQFQNNAGVKIAEVVQDIDYNDPVIAELLFSYPTSWIKNLDFSNDLTTSLKEIAGYVTFCTTNESHIEMVLLALSSVGLHAFESIGNWCHSLEVGCRLIETAPGVIDVTCTPRFSVDRARMFRFACHAHDPFDALIRYWHIVEHMYDDLIYDSVQNLLAASNRPKRFGKTIQDTASEATCAREVFKKYIDDTSYSSLVQFFNRNSLETHIISATTILGAQPGQLAFWNKNPQNGKDTLGTLLYSCRNAVAHRRESESWFDRLDKVHYQNVKAVIPIFHHSVHLMLQAM